MSPEGVCHYTILILKNYRNMNKLLIFSKLSFDVNFMYYIYTLFTIKIYYSFVMEINNL